jgi:lon-related putative ATP-dependent protease
MAVPEPLPRELLRRGCDPASLGFRTTDELAPLEDSLGQSRAVDAVRFGVSIRHEGYNLFALGPAGTGKYTLVRRYIEEQAATEPVPSDWCYVNNFTEPHKPRALRLPAGRGLPLRTQMERLVEDVRAAISTIFRGEEYVARKQAIEEEFKERQEQMFSELQQRASERSIAVIRTPVGFAFAPVSKGEPVEPDEFRRWPADAQEKVKKTVAELEDELQKLMKQVPQWQREERERLRALNHEVMSFTVSALIERLKEAYADLSDVLIYLDAVCADIVEHASVFMPRDAAGGDGDPMQALQHAFSGPPSFNRYHVNVIVDHSTTRSAPVIDEFRPTQPNLVGRIEHLAQFGALMTDFNLIQPGALHAANGGYLILDARKLLMQPFAYEELKRALQSRMIRTQGISEALGMSSTVSLDPEPIPLDLKVVLLGDRMLYFLLSEHDPDFLELFKVAVDFDDRAERTPENDLLFARLVAALAKRKNLRPFDASGVARVLEHAARLAADAERLSLHMRPIVDLLCEADHCAARAAHDAVTAADVQQAIDGQIKRTDRLRVRSQEEIARGTILIDTSGDVVGQINGIAVFPFGGFAFGRPSRITARVRLGRGELVDIEREVALGGPIHSKGVLILAGFLGERFGWERPLALSASLVFEQSYGGVDGDSASSAELYALLSALAGVPIKQSLAVTGSVNQRGEVQAVGGVNEKIEGFFDVCASRGLTGEQGVLIPAANIKHLMLRSDVLDAVEAKRFRVYAVDTVDQGIEILTGMPAGVRTPEGAYPPDTVNRAVEEQLAAFAERARAFGAAPQEEEKT